MKRITRMLQQEELDRDAVMYDPELGTLWTRGHLMPLLAPFKQHFINTEHVH